MKIAGMISPVGDVRGVQHEPGRARSVRSVALLAMATAMLAFGLAVTSPQAAQAASCQSGTAGVLRVSGAGGANLVADVTGMSREPGAAVKAWFPTGGDNQLFCKVRYGSSFMLVNVRSGLCLDASGPGPNPPIRYRGSLIIQWYCTRGLNQLWTTMNVNTLFDGYGQGPVGPFPYTRYLNNAYKNASGWWANGCLDVSGKNPTVLGAPLLLWDCQPWSTNPWNQFWSVLRDPA